MDKQMWLVVENNQYTLEMMKEYFQDQDVEIYGIKEDKIKECIHLHPYKIALVSYLSLQQISLIRYFKDLNIPVIVYDAKEGDKLKQFEREHVDKIMYSPNVYHQIFMVAYQLIRDYTAKEDELIYFKDLVLNVTKSSLKVNNKEMKLDDRELVILELLMSHPYQAYESSEIKRIAFKDKPTIEIKTIQDQIALLKEKMHELNPNEHYISHVWQVGYKMVL